MNEGFRGGMNSSKTERRAERREHPSVMLKRMLSEETSHTNKRVQETHQLENLLNPDGSLNTDGYTDVYSKNEMDVDKRTVRKRDLEFTNAQNERVKEFYKTKHNAKTEDEIIATWKENKSRDKNGQMEMAVTLLLSRMLGNNFLIVRTAPLDDYNGMDNLILDFTTGEVVGAFDEVHEGGDGDRTEIKKAKIQKIANNGGARVRYGIKLEEGKLKRAKLEGVPVFYLGLESEELDTLVNALQSDDRERMKAVYTKLTNSLTSQHSELSKHTINTQSQEKLAKFSELLSRITKDSVTT